MAIGVTWLSHPVMNSMEGPRALLAAVRQVLGLPPDKRPFFSSLNQRRLTWLRETESAAIADRCLCFQRLQECEAQLRKEGLVIQGSRGEVTHPVLRIARAYRTAMQRYDAELGLTPASRAGLQLSKTPFDGMDAIERALCSGLPD
jgi:P27 family predicted phage terminase small subunit